jgi:hypothetical protein
MAVRMILAGAAALMLLGGCEKAEAPAPVETTTTEVPAENIPQAENMTPAGAETPHRFADWKGKWVGVEGMFVTITPTDPGQYSVEMQSDLDTKGNYVGNDSAYGIKFERGGEMLSLTRASGDDIGLKWLAGKTDCLKVKDGEGYCRN